MWEVLSGAVIFSQIHKVGYYQQLLVQNKDNSSTAKDDIEKVFYQFTRIIFYAAFHQPRVPFFLCC